MAPARRQKRFATIPRTLTPTLLERRGMLRMQHASPLHFYSSATNANAIPFHIRSATNAETLHYQRIRVEPLELKRGPTLGRPPMVDLGSTCVDPGSTQRRPWVDPSPICSRPEVDLYRSSVNRVDSRSTRNRPMVDLVSNCADLGSTNSRPGVDPSSIPGLPSSALGRPAVDPSPTDVDPRSTRGRPVAGPWSTPVDPRSARR